MARIGYEFGVAAALCWLALGLESILGRHQSNVRDVFWVAPALLTAVTFWCVHFVQSGQAPELERTSHLIWQISCGLTIVSNFALLKGDLALTAARLPYTDILWAVTLVAFGIGTWKAAVFPRYIPVAIMLLEPASISTQVVLHALAPLQEESAYGGAVETALGMAVIAIGLRSATERLHWKSLEAPPGKRSVPPLKQAWTG